MFKIHKFSLLFIGIILSLSLLVGCNQTPNAYVCNFNCDENCSVSVFTKRDYSINPINTNKEYSRNGETGNYTKDGTGEINFIVNLKEGYDIDYVWARGLYDSINDPSKTENENVYQVTKIRNNLDINIKTKKIYTKNFASYDDLDNKTFNFSWDIKNNSNIKYINVDVYKNGLKDASLQINKNSLSYSAEMNTVYIFCFTPILNNNEKGFTYRCIRTLTNEPKLKNIPIIRINTKKNKIPKVNDPEINFISVPNDYIKSRIILEKNDIKIFDSNDFCLGYDGGKIKVRGNSSAKKYDKKPFKIKLSEPFDLLSTFRKRKKPDMDYKSNSWNLLALTHDRIDSAITQFLHSTNIFKTCFGFNINRLLGFSWDQEYEIVALYLNNDYKGLYLLCETYETTTNNNKISIESDGFLIENDYFSKCENLYFETDIANNRFGYTFKYPDEKNINEESELYIKIKNYMSEIDKKIINENEDVFDYIDIDTFARWLLVQEITANTDAPGANMYLYRRNMKDAKLSIGNCWDFDSCCNNETDLVPIREKPYFYYKYLLHMPKFVQYIKIIYSSVKDNVLDIVEETMNIDNVINLDNLLEYESRIYNCKFTSIETQKNNYRNFFANRLALLDRYYI